MVSRLQTGVREYGTHGWKRVASKVVDGVDLFGGLKDGHCYERTSSTLNPFRAKSSASNYDSSQVNVRDCVRRYMKEYDTPGG